MLSHNNLSMQLQGLLFIHAVLVRLNKLLVESNIIRSDTHNHQISLALARALPDFQALVTVRARLAVLTDCEADRD